MKREKNLPQIQEEFWELHDILNNTKFVNLDTISLGNLALFVDYFHNRYKWKEKKNKILHYAKNGKVNEINMFIAYNLLECAKKENLSDNLHFKIKKMEGDYRLGKLTHYDIVLDAYDFPDWFKRFSNYYPLDSPEDFYRKLKVGLKGFEVFNNPILNQNLFYFAESYYGIDNIYKKVMHLDRLMYEENINELSWQFSLGIFSVLFPQMKKAGKEVVAKNALELLKEYKTDYDKSKLKTFDLLSSIQSCR